MLNQYVPQAASQTLIPLLNALALIVIETPTEIALEY
jgi:hypothetical protein